HGKTEDAVSFTMQKGMDISYIHRPNGHRRDAYPGPPIIRNSKNNNSSNSSNSITFNSETNQTLQPYQYHFEGNGVWQSYFQPISDFVPGDKSCEHKPLVTMDLYLVTPGIHGFAPWAPKCWRYHYLPDYITKPHQPINEWLKPQRHAAHDVAKRYIRFLPHIQERAEHVNPECTLRNACLGIHIRQSDKAGGRRQIATDEFLPYVQAFLQSGGKWVYIATDSGKVMTHIQQSWPEHVRKVIRSMGDDVVRSTDYQAVFDIGSHHRTNTEILVEILALSKCQFMVHGLSAVTESSIWINVDLHYTSVNLEDPEHLNQGEFGQLVSKVLDGGNATQIMNEKRPSDWWSQSSESFAVSSFLKEPTNHACDDVKGVLHIAKTGSEEGVASTFFTSVVNQLIYADLFHLKPWIHLDSDATQIYDERVHGSGELVIQDGHNKLCISEAMLEGNEDFVYPGPLKPCDNAAAANAKPSSKTIKGNGIWSSYFDQVSDFVPGDESCMHKPLLSIESDSVTHGLNSWAPWSIKAWQYDAIPDHIWNSKGGSLQSWLEPMRIKGHNVVKKYFKFHPFLIDRANIVNPTNETSLPCLAVHLRNSDKEGTHRQKFPPNKFREYFNAFARAGGREIYIASDSHKTIEYINEHFPASIRRMIRTQGQYVVRTSWKWPAHMMEDHHRVNSEALVDILAMSKCQLLLHGSSAVSEAAIYLNLNLHNHSVNWENPDHMDSQQFERLAKDVLGTTGKPPVDLAHLEKEAAAHIIEESYAVESPRIIPGDEKRKCRRNAIVYLAQKRHSSYGRDSFGILMESLKLMNLNYLSRNDHINNTDVMIFHTADFTKDDMDLMESSLGTDFRAALRFVDLSNTTYWQRPPWHRKDNPLSWYVFPLFSEGYRRMMHWFAIDIWHYFRDYAAETGCEYEYIMRFDEDSFLHSPVDYDIFDFMKQNDYNYGFRLCSYEMKYTQRIWKLWQNSKPSPPIREHNLGMCGVYNNFFVAKLSFFQSLPVQRFLKFVDRQGLIYRRRLGDLMIHSLAIYSFSPTEKIHRFLDFTYEHSTVDKDTGCVSWGGIQAGYNDPNSGVALGKYMDEKVTGKGCTANITFPSQEDLSPTYQHLPADLQAQLRLKTIMAGNVELPGKGMLSG
ncbi:MAG: hypothetical protein SGILL_004329, partial [Bacillariaceae sp.]